MYVTAPHCCSAKLCSSQSCADRMAGPAYSQLAFAARPLPRSDDEHNRQILALTPPHKAVERTHTLTHTHNHNRRTYLRSTPAGSILEKPPARHKAPQPQHIPGYGLHAIRCRTPSGPRLCSFPAFITPNPHTLATQSPDAPPHGEGTGPSGGLGGPPCQAIQLGLGLGSVNLPVAFWFGHLA